MLTLTGHKLLLKTNKTQLLKWLEESVTKAIKAKVLPELQGPKGQR